jgi:hypothetical protein
MQVDIVSGTAGSKQSESYLNNTYDVPWTVLMSNGFTIVDLNNTTGTNVQVTTWVESTEGNGNFSDPSYAVTLGPNTETFVQFSDFPPRADGSQTTECIAHTVLTNLDNNSEGVEIWLSLWA